jgi:hypothetical protein
MPDVNAFENIKKLRGFNKRIFIRITNAEEAKKLDSFLVSAGLPLRSFLYCYGAVTVRISRKVGDGGYDNRIGHNPNLLGYACNGFASIKDSLHEVSLDQFLKMQGVENEKEQVENSVKAHRLP